MGSLADRIGTSHQEDTMNLYELAGKAHDAFETKQRPDGESYTTLKDDRPEWVYEIVREAHGEFLPDDWRYNCIRSAFAFIHDNEPSDEDSHEFADSEVDTYTASRFSWLSSNLQRQFYVDDAVSEFGPQEGVADAIGLGQYLEAQEVYSAVYSGLEDYLSEIED